MKENKIDYIISLSVFAQSFLVILQQIMIAVMGMPAESTTSYRVLFSVLTMGMGIFYSFKREPILFIKVYSLIGLLLLMNMLLFPHNIPYMEQEALRFFLPMVIPSALCLMSVKNIDIVEEALYYISWATFFMVFIYAISFFMGVFSYENYNMAFSYGCLLPMVGLYRKKERFALLASFLLLLVVLSIGSRGAAIAFVLYVLYDIIQYNRKYIGFLIVFILIASILLPIFIDWLASIGISSRTLLLLINGELDSDSGRGDIFKMYGDIVMNYPFGLGLWGDRTFLDGFYCHNIILEVIVDFGYLGGSVIILICLFVFLHIYRYSDRYNKNRLICYLLVIIAPLMVSGSYLIDYNFGLFCGILYLIYKDNIRKKQTKMMLHG